jgi:hypothetical protein
MLFNNKKRRLIKTPFYIFFKPPQRLSSPKGYQSHYPLKSTAKADIPSIGFIINVGI